MISPVQAPPLADRLGELLQGVHPDWPPYFENHALSGAIREALAAIEPDAGCLAPRPALIFEAFRFFGPEGAKVVIVGQDPYPEDAQGLSFSTPAGLPLKPSQMAILGNLERAGLARLHFTTKGDTHGDRLHIGDFASWAAQGVFLLNAALTTRQGGRGSHPTAWKAFSRGLVKALSADAAATGRPLIFMLWGSEARAFAPDIAGGLPVYQWTHPSPLINNRLPEASRFENAPHFLDANRVLRAAGLRPVEWDPLGFTYAFTDGSCPRNGRPDAEASFAAFVLTGPLKGVAVRGRVAPHTYALLDPADPFRGFVPAGGGAATPTNNRGEYLAWCWLLLLLLRGGIRGRAEVVSDCNLFIQTMDNWLPTRRRKGTAEALKNFDLILVAEALLAAVRAASAGVELTHVHSHQKKPPPGSDPRAQAFWYGNDRVDRAAGSLLAEGGPDLELSGTDEALRWRLLGRFEEWQG